MIPIDERDAMWIRMLRSEMGCTWGRIGELYQLAFGKVFNGGIPQSGASLCEWSAKLLNEDPAEAPWN